MDIFIFSGLKSDFFAISIAIFFRCFSNSTKGYINFKFSSNKARFIDVAISNKA